MKKLSKSDMRKVVGGNNGRRLVCGNCAVSFWGEISFVDCVAQEAHPPQGIETCICPPTGEICFSS